MNSTNIANITAHGNVAPIVEGTPEHFFYVNAGYSYNSKTETQEAGRARCAIALAEAEKAASEKGYSFEWSQDDITNRDFTDEGNEYYLWACLCRDEAGRVVGSLGGVDFGDGNEPWGQDYRRVVEAEIASEAL